MKRCKVGLILAALVLALAVFAAGCLDKAKIKALYDPDSVPTPSNAAADANAPQSYALQGSVTAIPLMQAVADALASSHPIDFVAVGKDEAVAAVLNNEIDAAIYDGKPSELDDPSKAKVIASEGVYVVVNPDFPADDISYDQIVAIFTDQDNLLADQPVNIVVTNPDTLGRKVFEDIFPIKGDVDGTPESMIPDVATVVDSDEQVISAVAADPSAIGIVSMTTPPENVKALSIDGVAPDAEGYAGSRSLLLLCKDREAEASKAIIAFLGSPQAVDILTDNGYVSVK